MLLLAVQRLAPASRSPVFRDAAGRGQRRGLCPLRKLRIVEKDMVDAPMTVVETARFLKDVKPMMSDSEREELVSFVGANPEAGEIIPETGGVRKIRWALAGRGKRGGARVIYYYHDERIPVFLLAAYGKNEKANLSRAERNAMKRLIPVLVAGYPLKDRKV